MGMHRHKGFTLLELLVAVVVLGVVLTLGVPSFTQFVQTNRMASGVNDLVATLHSARTEAVKRKTLAGANASVSICASADWNTAAPSCDAAGNFRDGWITFADIDGDIVVDAGDRVLAVHGPVANALVLNTLDVNGNPVGQQFFSFGASGFLRAAAPGQPLGNLQFCDVRGDLDAGGGIAAGRFVLISPTGRPQIFRMRADVQNPVLNPIGGC